MEGTAYATPVAPGDVLAGKYRVERVLGRGAMGIVVAARHLELGELFALKLMLPQAAAHAQAVERFLREARAAARIKGEHVARVTDVGRLENGSPYMVMEHLHGSDLQQVVEAQGPLPVDQAILLMLQACEALAEAHGLGIVHRDLKPSNLFLTTRANGTPCLKILDFGISKQVAQDAVDLTKTGDVFGTPLYMAPEQMSRTKDVDARSDIWSVGAVLYELLTGRSPFHATTLTEVIARVLQEDPAPPSGVCPRVPPQLDAIVLRCLQKRPADRYSHVKDLAVALRGLHDHFSATVVPSASVLQLPVRSSPAAATTAQEPPTARLAIFPAPGVSPVAPIPGSASAASNTVSAWGATGPRRLLGKSGSGWRILIGGILAASCATVGVWFVSRDTGQAAVPAHSDPFSGELTLPVSVTVSEQSFASEVAPATTATVSTRSGDATAPSAAATANAPPRAEPPSPPSPRATTTVRAKPAATKKYQDAY